MAREGTTVYEAAVVEERRLLREIEELQSRLSAARVRQRVYRGSSMLESERLATAAERFQRTTLSEATHAD